MADDIEAWASVIGSHGAYIENGVVRIDGKCFRWEARGGLRTPDSIYLLFVLKGILDGDRDTDLTWITDIHVMPEIVAYPWRYIHWDSWNDPVILQYLLERLHNADNFIECFQEIMKHSPAGFKPVVLMSIAESLGHAEAAKIICKNVEAAHRIVS